MPTARPTVAVITADPAVRRRATDALAESPVQVVSADPRQRVPHPRVVGDVAVVDRETVDQWTASPDRVAARQILILTPGEPTGDHTHVAKPADAATLRETVHRLLRRIAYANGLAIYAGLAAAGDGGPLRALRDRLDALLTDFGHEDFVDAFRAVADPGSASTHRSGYREASLTELS